MLAHLPQTGQKRVLGQLPAYRAWARVKPRAWAALTGLIGTIASQVILGDEAIGRNIDPLMAVLNSAEVVHPHQQLNAESGLMVFSAENEFVVGDPTTCRSVHVGRFFRAPNEYFGMARVLANGALDASFGKNGEVLTAFPGNNALATAVGLQADGNIVVAGTSDGQLAVARYLGQ